MQAQIRMAEHAKADMAIRLKTKIAVPEVFGHDLSADNEVGAPYILMSYMHGTSAAELSELRDCDPETFGTAEQDARFRQQMANIHVQLASLTFDRIGSLRESHDNPGDFFIGSEIETGEGPWDTAQQYYSAVARHRLQVAEHDAEPEVRECDSFNLPHRFCELMPLLQSRETRPYGLANRDFGAHNVLVDDDFNIIGLIDFDGVIAAPIELVAQLPLFTGLERPIPGFVETGEFALKRIERTKHQVPQYIEFVSGAIAEAEATVGLADSSGLADAMVSDAASAVQGMNAYGQHQGFVNDRWMAAYAMLLEKATGSSDFPGLELDKGPSHKAK